MSTTRTIEIKDDLQDRINIAIEEVFEYFNEFKEAKPDGDAEDFISYLEYDGRISEIVDSATPVYYSEIHGLWYLYHSEFEQAYEDAGCYDEKPENYQKIAIYFYIEQQLYQAIRDNFDE